MWVLITYGASCFFMDTYYMLDKTIYQITKPIPALPFFLGEKGKGSERCKKISIFVFNLYSPFHFSLKKKGRGSGGWVSIMMLSFLNTIGCVYPLKHATRLTYFDIPDISGNRQGACGNKLF